MLSTLSAMGKVIIQGGIFHSTLQLLNFTCISERTIQSRLQIFFSLWEELVFSYCPRTKPYLEKTHFQVELKKKKKNQADTWNKANY